MAILSSHPTMLILMLTLLGASRLVQSDSGNDLGPFDDNKSSLTCQPPYPYTSKPMYDVDVALFQFAQNIEHLEADFFLWGALGYGLDVVAPELTTGGPPPTGARMANLDNFTSNIIKEFGFEEVGHLRILKNTVGGIPRPLIDLSPNNFAKIVDKAFERTLQPSFDPYRDSLSYMLASYVLPYVGLTGYVGANPLIKGYVTKRLLSGLLAVESGQDAVIRMYLYGRANEIVHPYNFTVAEFTYRISSLRNILGSCGVKDEGVVVSSELGAERKTSANVLSANQDSAAYDRTPAEILRIVYGTGDEHIPGGFYPEGGNGEIAKKYLKPSDYLVNYSRP